jgi:hypothetical protein
LLQQLRIGVAAIELIGRRFKNQFVLGHRELPCFVSVPRTNRV